MSKTDIKDFNIKDENNLHYNKYRITEDIKIALIVQKIEVLLLTNTGDVLGQPKLGCDLIFYLWSTEVAIETIRLLIYEQVRDFVPEAFKYNFNAVVKLYEGTFRDILIINITLKDASVEFILK